MGNTPETDALPRCTGCARVSPEMEATETDPALTPSPPELIARAEALVREYGVQCFWFWHPDARVRTREDVQLVVKELRRNGSRKAWLAAKELKRCL